VPNTGIMKLNAVPMLTRLYFSKRVQSENAVDDKITR
jgi:hypothetical protein